MRSPNNYLVLAEDEIAAVRVVVEDRRQRPGRAVRTDEIGRDRLDAVQVEDQAFQRVTALLLHPKRASANRTIALRQITQQLVEFAPPRPMLRHRTSYRLSPSAAPF